MRFNMPLLGGGFNREVHCLDMMPQLAENGYKSFAIPWGAAHMPVMSQMLSENGFEEIGQSSLSVFNSIDGMYSDGWVRRFDKINRRHNYFWIAAGIWYAWFCQWFFWWILIGFNFSTDEDEYAGEA